MALADIDHSIEIEASPERVWTVMTQEGLVAEWLGCLQFSPRVGQLFYMQPHPQRREAGDIDGATHCELLALEPPRRMRFSWFMPGTPKTHVEISLTALGADRTRVRLRHDGWDQFDEAQVKAIRDMLDGGWSSFVLPGLKRVAER